MCVGFGKVLDGSGGGWEAMVRSFGPSIELKDDSARNETILALF